MNIHEELAHDLDIQLSAVKDDLKAAKMKVYMKDKFSYYGVSAPLRKEVFAGFFREHKSRLKSCFREFTLTCFDNEHREIHYCAMDAFDRVSKQLQSDDLGIIEKIITTHSWWDTVDLIASNTVGKFMKRYPDLIPMTNDKWIDSGNIWLQRTAILFQLKYKDSVDKELLFSNIRSVKSSKEFFLRKASGWALRQLSKFDPGAVRQFLKDNPDLSTLTVREASKYLI